MKKKYRVTKVGNSFDRFGNIIFSDSELVNKVVTFSDLRNDFGKCEGKHETEEGKTDMFGFIKNGFRTDVWVDDLK